MGPREKGAFCEGPSELKIPSGRSMVAKIESSAKYKIVFPRRFLLLRRRISQTVRSSFAKRCSSSSSSSIPLTFLFPLPSISFTFPPPLAAAAFSRLSGGERGRRSVVQEEGGIRESALRLRRRRGQPSPRIELLPPPDIFSHISAREQSGEVGEHGWRFATFCLVFFSPMQFRWGAKYKVTGSQFARRGKHSYFFLISAKTLVN